MTFDARETSLAQGEPVALYEFVRGTYVWRYTGAPQAVTLGAITYAPETISHTAIEQSGESKRAGTTITVPRGNAVAAQWGVAPPGDAIAVTIRSLHVGDTDATVEFIGRVATVQQQGSAMRLTCEAAYAGMQRMGLRLAWQIQCPHVLYGPGCGLDPELWAVPATLSAAAGLVVSAAAFAGYANGYFAGGYLRFETEPGVGVYERRSIEAHTGADLTLNYGAPQLAAGLAVRAYPGCDHSTGAAGCGRFGNLPNHGGAPYMPRKSPNDGTPVF